MLQYKNNISLVQSDLPTVLGERTILGEIIHWI